jgi:hypothetical protein
LRRVQNCTLFANGIRTRLLGQHGSKPAPIDESRRD